MQNWTDHLREAIRLSDDDRQALGRVVAFHCTEAPAPSRFIAVDPSLRLARNAV